MNIAILGAGAMGKTHTRAFAKLPDVNIISISSRTLSKAQQLASEVNATATTDDMALVLDPRVDAVSITLPTHLHKKFTIAALRAGKHVLLEKPFALTLADCDAMMRACKKSGKVLMVAHVLRFWSEYLELVKLIQSGVLGKPRSATAARMSTRPRWAGWFRDPKLSGGAVMDLMIHDFDMLNLIFGAPQKVFARGRKSKHGAWDHVLATIEYRNASAFVEGTVMMPARFAFTMKLNVQCERGAVEYNFRAGGARVEERGETSLHVFTDDASYDLNAPTYDAYESQIAYFVDCVRNQRQPKQGTPAQARLAVALSLATRKSLETGRVVPIRQT
jgi:UDP-N-acetylglucosamine 3-dehydrogenase